MGHFLNKALKDMINRWMLLRGCRVDFTPGWDCHGLPIELRALQIAGVDSAHALPPLQIRSQAAACAREAIDAQRASFVRWGVMGDWEKPYTTMQPTYEAAQLGVLEAMLGRGLVFRGARPVHWSPASRTALAEAELDYVDAHSSTAAFVAFPVRVGGEGSPPPSWMAADASLVIWTTTPWTLPANEAVCARADLTYSLVEVDEREAGRGEGSEGGGGGGRGGGSGERLVVASSRVEALEEALAQPLRIHATFPGAELGGLRCAHPLSGREVPILFAEHVTDTAGTGLVHTAPAHGPDDYAVGLEHGLSLVCPVDERGLFTAAVDEAAPFVGLEVLSTGNVAVLDALRSSGALLAASEYSHRYPYDWRSKTPTIFRTTPQWFVELSSLRELALASLDSVAMLPASGRARLEAFVRGRSEWCLSRQRSWGVPLPAFYHTESGEALLTAETVAHVRSLVAERGSNCWWELDESELLPPRLQDQARLWRKGTDTLDVWFDSGTSWSAVLGEVPLGGANGAQEAGEGGGGLLRRADLYLEGSDQHRGWFQSSLLTHVGVCGVAEAPYGSIVTHGFVVDERGAKMSKSLGNVIVPSQLLGEGSSDATGAAAAAAVEPSGKKKPLSKKQRKELRQAGGMQAPFGVDVLRLWVAMSDWTADVAVGEAILQKSREAYRRLRNSCRFMLGNLHDFDSSTDALPHHALRMGDRYMLHQLAEFASTAERSHDAHAVSRVVHSALSLASESLSADYFDATKDRLYCAAAGGESRRAVQTVLHATLDTLLLALGPITPFLAEEAHEYRAEPRPSRPVDRIWQSPPAEWLQPDLARQWRLALAVRAEVGRLLHDAQQEKLLGGTAEALVEIVVEAEGELQEALSAIGGELNDILGVCGTRVRGGIGGADEAPPPQDGALRAFEGAVVAPGASALGATREHAIRITIFATDSQKCARCWRHVPPDVARSGVEGVQLDDGWVYRGCPRDAEEVLCPVKDLSVST
jgi:isoleucyl-tRNA synthetase